MKRKSVISLSTGLEDAEKVTVAFLVAVGSVESERPTLMFLTKEAVRLVVSGVARGTACEGCPPLEDLMRRYAAAGGRFMVCPICFDAKHLDKGALAPTQSSVARFRCGSGSAMTQPTPSATGTRRSATRWHTRSPPGTRPRCGRCSPPRCLPGVTPRDSGTPRRRRGGRHRPWYLVRPRQVD